MLSQTVRNSLRSAVLAGSTVALLAGTGLALAQPGSRFQTQGIREANGQRATPSVWSRTAHGVPILWIPTPVTVEPIPFHGSAGSARSGGCYAR